MSIIVIRCTQCGANLEIDDTKKKVKCRYCGADTNYIKEEKTKNEFQAQSQQFYKLDTNRPYSAENSLSNYWIVFLILSVFFIVIFVLLLSDVFFDYADYEFFYFIILPIIGLVFLILAVVFMVKYFKVSFVLKETALNGHVTFAKIEKIESRWAPFGRGRRIAEIFYIFVDNNGKSRHDTFKRYYHFFFGVPYQEGEQVTILFDQDKSFVLKKYNLANTNEIEN